jgi:hypothetical protein
MAILKILTGFNKKNLTNGWKWKKLKDVYFKLTLFKFWVLNYKSDKRSRVISEVFPKFYLL